MSVCHFQSNRLEHTHTLSMYFREVKLSFFFFSSKGNFDIYFIRGQNYVLKNLFAIFDQGVVSPQYNPSLHGTAVL